MRSLTATVLAATVLLVVIAAPASALKDPFDPVITSDTAGESSTTGATTTTGTTTTGTTTTTNGTGESPFSEGVPTTGADTASWLVLAYVLTVVGGGALVLARTLAPAGAPRRR